MWILSIISLCFVRVFAYKEENLLIFIGTNFGILIGIGIYVCLIVRKRYRTPQNPSAHFAHISLDTAR